jgi:hypothetical protein
MSNDTEDTGMIEAMLQRLNDFRLPRLLELRGRVEGGAKIDQYDIDFLEQVLKDAHAGQALNDRHPELQSLVAKLTALYHEITSKALENETKSQGR